MSICSVSSVNFKGAICVKNSNKNNRYTDIIKTNDIRYMERAKYTYYDREVNGTKIEYTNPRTKNAEIVVIPEKLETVLLAYNAVKDTEGEVNFFA